MAQAAIPLLIAGGTALSAYGQYRGGLQAERAGRFEAAQLEQTAGQTLAVSQRQAQETARQGRLAQSRALAVAAAGGGASDPSVIRALAQMAGETTYRQMVNLYEGEQQAQQARLQAKVARKQGKEARRAGQLGVLGTVLASGASLHGKYGVPGSKGGAS